MERSGGSMVGGDSASFVKTDYKSEQPSKQIARETDSTLSLQ